MKSTVPLVLRPGTCTCFAIIADLSKIGRAKSHVVASTRHLPLVSTPICCPRAFCWEGSWLICASRMNATYGRRRPPHFVTSRQRLLEQKACNERMDHKRNKHDALLCSSAMPSWRNARCIVTTDSMPHVVSHYNLLEVLNHSGGALNHSGRVLTLFTYSDCCLAVDFFHRVSASC
jgi:hypothetical protein